MGNNPPGSRKLKDTKSNSIDNDIYDTSWLEAVDKSFVYVWCDASIGTQNNIDDANNTLKNIANIVNKNRQLVHTFNEIKPCQEFISHVNNVCLIISGTYGRELVPQIHNLEQIHSIYIFCINKEKHELWATHYRKVRGVFTNIRGICDSLQNYVASPALIDYDRIEFDIFNADIKNLDLTLVYSILTKILILNIDSDDHGKRNMITYCRNEYTSDSQIQLINDFERNYSKFNPIWWYTKSYFFQGIINRALRTRDLYALCSMHRLLKDLELVLLELYNKQKTSDEPLNLYFGQILSHDDLTYISNSRGQLMCINQLISANPEKAISIMFMKEHTLQPKKIRIIFQIHIDRTVIPIVPYAKIVSMSDFVHEHDHLISIFSVYRIGEIVQVLDMSSTWLVHLTLIGKEDTQYMQLTQSISLEQLEDIDIDHGICDRLNQFKSANKLFKQALSNPENKAALRAIVLHYDLALIYDAFGDYEKSLEQFRNTLTMARKSIATCQQNDDLCLIPIYSNMGITYQQDNKFSYAVDHAYRALQIVSAIKLHSVLKKELESSCNVNCGMIHDREGKISDAKMFYERALRIRQEYLLMGHPDITALQRLITLLPEKTSDSDSLQNDRF